MDKNKLERFLSYFAKHQKLFWPSVERTAEKNEQLFKELGVLMTNWSATYLGDDYVKTLADGYARFVTDVNKSQMKYEKRGHYPNKTYDEVFAGVYDNEEHMASYHWGVYVTTFAWEHHLRIYKFYKDYFLSLLNCEGGLLLDMGSGSGIWGMLVLYFFPGWKVQGVDISKTSVDFANRMAESNGFGSRAKYVEGDALLYSGSERIDACISCFLLEHLESPHELLMNLADNLKVGGMAFVTAALTAAEVDHITEFRNESDLVIMAEKADFRVVASYSSAPPSYPSECRFLPRSMALVLQKRRNEIW